MRYAAYIFSGAQMRRFPARSAYLLAIGILFLSMPDHSARGHRLRLAAAGASIAASVIALTAARRTR